MKLAGRTRQRAAVALAVLALTSAAGFVVSRLVAAQAETVSRAVDLLESTYALSALAHEYSRVGSERLAEVWRDRNGQLATLAQSAAPALGLEAFLEQLHQLDQAFSELRALLHPRQPTPLTEDHRLLLTSVALGQIAVIEQRMLTQARGALNVAEQRIDAAVTGGAWVVFAVIVLGGALMLAVDRRLSRHVQRELERLQDSARRIGAGQFDVSTTGLTIDEMRELGNLLAETGAQLSLLTQDLRGSIEQLRAEVARRERSDQRMALVSSASNDGLWDWDIDADRMWWSDGLQALAGRGGTESEHPGSVLLQQVEQDDRERVSADLRRALRGSDTQWLNAFALRRVDGTTINVEVRARIVRDERGRARRMVGGVSNVTERLRLEAELRQVGRLESLGQLTGGVAHDFNNLLTVILGNAELLSEVLPEGGEPQRLARMVGAAAQRGAELTQRLLAFARKQALAPKVVDVNQLVAGMDALLRRSLGEHIAIEWVRGAGLWPALVDPGQLENALLNLALNARDAMPQGGKLTIETANAHLDEDYAARHAELQPGQYAMVAVSDTGVGIEPAHLAQVFEPFFTTKGKGKGTGLGLAMVYGFVKQSQGHVAIYSEPGRGTTVKLYLPRPGAGEAAAEAEPAGAMLAGQGELVLLVEDDALVRQYAGEQLRALGYRVLEAADGPQALEQLRRHAQVALLFTDVVMPGGMSGRELAQAARALRPGLPVLYTSGYTENAIVHHGRLDPGVLLLGKPYRRHELARKLLEALARGPVTPTRV